MHLLELLLLAIGLSMDAFAVSVCKGLAMRKVRLRDCMICGLWFGGFQALMPTIGYFLGARFEKLVNAVSPWIAFGLLAVIGINMIREALSREEEETDPGLDVRTMFMMAVATSIDALAVGITFALVPVKLVAASATVNTLIGACLIGLTTCLISCFGVWVGHVAGDRYKSGAELAGGTILVFLGMKIWMENLGAASLLSNDDVVFGLLIPFAATAIGAAMVFAPGKGKPALSERFQRNLTGFAAGIMTAAAVWCLMIPASRLSPDMGILGILPVFAGFWMGVLVQLFLDHHVPHIHNFSAEAEGVAETARDAADGYGLRRMMAVLMHHIPEGIAIGVVYGAYLVAGSGISAAAALAVAIGIAIQNLPEAMVLSMPLRETGQSARSSFLMGVLSGAVQPLMGLLTAIIIGLCPALLPYVMAFAAGAIVFVVVEELIPEMSAGPHSDAGVLLFSVGFSVMVLLAYMMGGM